MTIARAIEIVKGYIDGTPQDIVEFRYALIRVVDYLAQRDKKQD